MTAPTSDCRIVPSIETTVVAVDPYVGTPQYDGPAGDNQNKLFLLGMTIHMTSLK